MSQAHAHLPEWEELRDLASAIKEHTLTHLDTYLEQFEAAAVKANGVHVHWAKDGAEHNAIVLGILRDAGAKTLIKSKSMLTEECGMREFLTANGIEITETDLGERIQQLDKEAPSHVVVPAGAQAALRRRRRVFAHARHGAGQRRHPHYLAESQRETTRPLILDADAGMTGGNFIVAETGAVVTCTNEGNADLSANTPKLHIASVGIEKLVPRIERSRRVHPPAVAQRARLADHPVHLAFQARRGRGASDAHRARRQRPLGAARAGASSGRR